MKVTFVSNYINHHQIPFCEAMYEKLGEEYCFIQTEPMEEERVRMGWGAQLDKLLWLKVYYEQEAECKKLINDSDVVLFGGVEDESYITERLAEGKVVVRLSERIYKEGQWKAISPRGLKKKYHDHTKYRKSPVYLLCCGGYVASDFHIVRAYPGKMFQWGYFPEKKTYDIDALLAKKANRREKSGKVSLLWAGRFIDWKHPEYAVQAAAKLKQEGYDFALTMVGGGAMEKDLHDMVKAEELEDVVTFAGFQKPEKVREYMEQSDIFLFTSDYKEGWGAVLNEAMNSGCAVVANVALGAVPFLIKPEENGLIYPNKKFAKFYENVTKLIQNPNMINELGREAYQTIAKEWNAEVAANRLVPFLEQLMKGEVIPQREGILSPAFIVRPGRMYKYLTGKKN
ncbi:MAG: glycosyltransferase family 4 protein [Lachnospiraceae bacterium]|nr:glycosyltransferase family 4 protein [Lachnospiraceae bacterium]